MTQAALHKKALFYRKFWLIFKKETRKVLNLERGFIWCWKLDNSKNKSEVPGKFWNVVLENDGEGELYRSCEKWGSITGTQGERNILQTVKRMANWIGHSLCRNCLLKHIVEGKIEGRVEVMGRRGRRCKQVLPYLKEATRCCKLKEEALDRIMWRTGFGRTCGT
jgi:hypothetical protein